MSNGKQLKSISDLADTVLLLTNNFDNEVDKNADFKSEVRGTLKGLKEDIETLQQTVASMKGQQMMVPFLVSTAIGVFFFIINLIQK